jgi:peptide chain release factor 1
MPALSDARLSQVLDRFDAVEARLGATTDSAEIVALSKERAELEPVAAVMRALMEARRELIDLEALSADPEMGAIARDELVSLKARLPEMERAAQIMLLPKDEAEKASAILEIRAGTGGDEAALFAGDLFRMYARYAQIRGWKVEIEDESPSDLGGYKEIIASVTGEGVFGRLRFESGVHRVQRVPETEAGGRIHTSAATVAVLPEAEDVDIVVNDADIRIDTMRASGAGGQHVNKTDSAVRITHLPTGIVVTSSLKSQHQNRVQAMKVLKARLYDMERSKRDAERSADRAAQVGSGDRSERIRTYNFPQGRVTDHRIGLTLYNLTEVVAGAALDDVVEALLADDQAKKLAALEG